MKYICISRGKEITNDKGEVIGHRGLRVLCYDKKLHRQRIYRRSYPNTGEAFQIFAYKRKSKAQELCDCAGEDFEVMEIPD